MFQLQRLMLKIIKMSYHKALQSHSSMIQNCTTFSKKKTPFHFLFVSFNFLNICNISGWGCIHLLISLKLNTARIKTLLQVPDIKAFRFRYTQFYIWNLWPTCSVDFVVFGFFFAFDSYFMCIFCFKIMS